VTGRKLSKKLADVQVRRQKYYQARREGLDMWAAGNAAGLEDPGTIKRYERWWQQVGRKEDDEG
jgi:hypothetical protein